MIWKNVWNEDRVDPHFRRQIFVEKRERNLRSFLRGDGVEEEMLVFMFLDGLVVSFSWITNWFIEK